MSELLPDLRGRVRVDTSDIEGAVGRASKAGSMIGSALGTLGGNVATGLLDTAFQGIKSLTIGSVTAASDLGETANKIATVFGPAADAVNAFASNSATQFGLSKQAALDASATFGVFGKSAGLSGKDLSGFSTQFTGLAADLASFNNTTPEEAIMALGAGLRGESEPLRRFGVLLDDMTLRQEAVRLGLTKTTKEALTPQQKVLASQAAILKQTGDAQGDFSKTSDGLANRTRIAKAEFADLQTKLGQGLLPIVNVLMGALVGLFGPLGDVATAISDGIGGAFERLQAGGGVGDTFASMQTALSGLGTALQGAMALILPSLQNLANLAREQILPALQSVWNVIATNVIPALSELIDALAPVAKFLIDALGPVVVAVIKVLYQNIASLLSVVGNLVRFVARIFKGDWAGAWQALKDAAAGAAKVLIGTVTGLWGIIVGIFRRIGPAIIGLFRRAWDGVTGAASSGVSRLMGFVRSIPGRVTSALGNLGSLLAQKGRDLVQGLIDGVLGKIEDVKNAAGRIAGAIRDFFPGSPVKTGPLTAWNNGRAGRALGDLLAGGLDASLGTVRQASSGLAQAAAGGLGARVPTTALPGAQGPGSAPGVTRLHPADIQALAAAVSTTVLLDGDTLASRVSRKIGSDTYGIVRAG